MSADSQTLPPVVVIIGPTASGKTELAARLARELGGEVVGADSRQVYRYMEVGTAKPSAELRREIPHHLIDVVDPDQSYDVATWRRQAVAALADIDRRGLATIVCGGSSLYIRSLLYGLFEGPAADAELRERLEADELDHPGSLYGRLCIDDPEAAARIHPNDKLRIVRALEVLELTGRPLSAWHGDGCQREPRPNCLVFELRMTRELLYARIDARARAIVDAGLLGEMRELRARGYAHDLRAFEAIGYREAGLCLDGRLAERDLAAEIARATRRYAKRQLVWLRGHGDFVPLYVGDDSSAVRRAESFLAGLAKRGGTG